MLLGTTTLVVLVFAAFAAAQPGDQLGPTYTLQTFIQVDNSEDRGRITANISVSTENEYFEWESYDGWFNNPAHPEWGGAGE